MSEQTVRKKTKKYSYTKDLIDNTFRKLVAEIGINNITVDLLCKEANITRSNFYYYYKNREDMILSRFKIIDNYFSDIVAKDLKSNSSFDNLVTFANYYFKFCIDLDLAYIKQIYNAQLLIGGEDITSLDRPVHKILIDIIEKGQKSGEIINSITSTTLAHSFMIYIRGIKFDWCVHNGNYDLLELGNNLIKLYLKSFLI